MSKSKSKVLSEVIEQLQDPNQEVPAAVIEQLMEPTAPEQVVTEPVAPNDLGYDPTHLNGLPSTSAKIRYLDDLGMKRSRICKILKYKDGRELRYQHVRNVLITPLKKQS